jgi:hypothetical protein
VRQRTVRAAGVAAAITAATVFAAVAGARGPRPNRKAAVAAAPTITIISPRNGASYQRGSRIVARFSCRAATPAARIASCLGDVPRGHPLNSSSAGEKRFTVTATDTSGNTVTQTVSYTVWTYVNPVRAVAGLQASRIDMGVDYSGSGPIAALGRAKIILATDRLAGPEGCWGKTCVPPPGDMIVYRLLEGPFVDKYVYVVEHITITVKAGQTIRAGETVAILHQGSPNLELGWASGYGAYTLAAARRHQCSCTDPGGWSSVEGRDFNDLMVWLGAPSGYVTSTAPNQHMPGGWPALPRRSRSTTGASRSLG